MAIAVFCKTTPLNNYDPLFSPMRVHPNSINKMEAHENLSWVWDESFWFPPDRPWGWKDLVNVEGSDVYLPQPKDLNWSILYGILLIGVRYLLETFLVIPLAVKFGIPNKKRRPLALNPTLEQAFQKTKNPDQKHIQALCKQTDLTERQVQIWFRKRQLQDKPTPMQKFRECSWHLIFYGIVFVYGLYALYDKPWFWETKYCWIGWPKIHIPQEIYWYYTIELAFYWSLIFTLFTDHKRKDFKEMIIHHVATVVLLYFSWVMNFVPVGTLVLLVHDAADSWLALAKMAAYLKNEKLTDFFFVGFLVVWIISRLGFYPFVILYTTTIECFEYVMDKTFGSHWFFNFFLYILLVLHILWSYSIGRIVYRRLQKGKVEDVRSDLDDTEEEEGHDIKTNNLVHEMNGVVNGKPASQLTASKSG